MQTIADTILKSISKGQSLKDYMASRWEVIEPDVGYLDEEKLKASSDEDDHAHDEPNVIYAEYRVGPLAGSTGIDHIIGSRDADEIDGLHGNDIIEGNGGDDYLTGNFGDDLVLGGQGADTIFGGEGNDFLSASSDFRLSPSGPAPNLISPDFSHEDEMLFGGAGKDTIFGGAGNDIIDGGEGRDHVYAFDGADMVILRHDDGDDEIHLGEDDAQDTIYISGDHWDAHGPQAFGSDTVQHFGGNGNIADRIVVESATGMELDAVVSGSTYTIFNVYHHGQLVGDLTIDGALGSAAESYVDVI